MKTYKFVVELTTVPDVESSKVQALALLGSALLSTNKFTKQGEYHERGSFESLRLSNINLYESQSETENVCDDSEDVCDDETKIVTSHDVLNFITDYNLIKKYLDKNFLYIGEPEYFHQAEAKRIKEEYKRSFTAEEVLMMYWWTFTADKMKVTFAK